MGIFQSHYVGSYLAPEQDAHHAQWVAGTYVVTGVFQRQCTDLALKQIQDHIPHLGTTELQRLTSTEN
jgi:hypothetical protein